MSSVNTNNDVQPMISNNSTFNPFTIYRCGLHMSELPCYSLGYSLIFNPQHACAARVTVVSLSV